MFSWLNFIIGCSWFIGSISWLEIDISYKFLEGLVAISLCFCSFLPLCKSHLFLTLECWSSNICRISQYVVGKLIVIALEFSWYLLLTEIFGMRLIMLFIFSSLKISYRFGN